MDQDTPSRTAEAITAARAFGMHLLKRLHILDDPFAHHFLTESVSKRYRLVCRLAIGPLKGLVSAYYERKHPGAIGWALIRHRYIDDAVGAAVRSGIQQVVIIGAGYDTRALRLGLGDAVNFIEVDRTGTQRKKIQTIQRMLGAVPSRVKYVALDIASDSLSAIEEAGFDRRQRAIFILEGLLWYLPETVSVATLRSISSLAAPLSLVVFDYILPDVLDPRVENLLGAKGHVELSARFGEPILSAIDPAKLDQYLDSVGLQLLDTVGHRELAALYHPVPMHAYFRIARATTTGSSDTRG